MNNYVCQCEDSTHHHKGKCKDPIERHGTGKCDRCKNIDRESSNINQ